jgi:hypothetical protein
MSIWTNCPHSRLKLWTLLTVSLFSGRYLGASAEWGGIKTLGYPKAALFVFCRAIVAFNILSVVKRCNERDSWCRENRGRSIEIIMMDSSTFVTLTGVRYIPKSTPAKSGLFPISRRLAENQNKTN